MPSEVARRGLAVRLSPADAATVREIAAETGSKQSEVLAVLERAAAQAIRSGALMKSIVGQRVRELQGLLFERPAEAQPEPVPAPEPSFEPPPASLFLPPPVPGAPPADAPSVLPPALTEQAVPLPAPKVARRKYK